VLQPLSRGEEYTIQIYNQYPVHQFAGRKFIYITTTTWLGGANDFLGIAYMAVGSACILVGIVFLIKHAVSPRYAQDRCCLCVFCRGFSCTVVLCRKLGDPQYLNFEG
jgi:hypothetical protein